MESIYLLEHLNKQYHQLCIEGQTFVNNPSKDRVAVIVEPRRHELLFQVIRNVMYNAGNNWNLHVFTTEENIEWIRDGFKGCSFRITLLNKNNITRDEYSMILMSDTFWNTIPEENVLIFQTDCVLFRKGLLDIWIDDHDHGFDYVGANYYNPNHVTASIGGIQGGLSLRKKSAMLDCIKNVSLHDVHAYRSRNRLEPIYNFIHEDVFFTHACSILNKRVPSIEKRREFSIEADYYPAALGHHGLTHKYLTAEQQRELISNT